MALTRTRAWLRAAAATACLALLPSAAQASAMEVEILYPREQSTVHDNSGTLRVALHLSALEAGAQVVLLLDGRPMRTEIVDGQRLLRGVDRGTHRLQARILDANGAVVSSSAVITFHMWQASRLFPSRNPAR